MQCITLYINHFICRYSGTPVLIINSFLLVASKQRLMKHFLLRGGVLASAVSGEQAPSAETFFLIKMQQVPCLMSCEVDKYRGTV